MLHQIDLQIRFTCDFPTSNWVFRSFRGCRCVRNAFVGILFTSSSADETWKCGWKQSGAGADSRLSKWVKHFYRLSFCRREFPPQGLRRICEHKAESHSVILLWILSPLRLPVCVQTKLAGTRRTTEKNAPRASFSRRLSSREDFNFASSRSDLRVFGSYKVMNKKILFSFDLIGTMANKSRVVENCALFAQLRS